MTSETDTLEALAKNVDEERRRVEAAAQEIQHKLTPGQLIDEILQQGGEPARNALVGLGKTIAAHPVPTLLMGQPSSGSRSSVAPAVRVPPRSPPPTPDACRPPMKTLELLIQSRSGGRRA